MGQGCGRPGRAEVREMKIPYAIDNRDAKLADARYVEARLKEIL